MYLRHSTVRQDGKTHVYWRLVRSVRVGARVRQETVATYPNKVQADEGDQNNIGIQFAVQGEPYRLINGQAEDEQQGHRRKEEIARGRARRHVVPGGSDGVEGDPASTNYRADRAAGQ